ncbi:MAG: PepSY domain-containing protein [Galactobacter sp.]
MKATKPAAFLTTLSGLALTSAALTGCAGDDPAPTPASSSAAQQSQQTPPAQGTPENQSTPASQGTPENPSASNGNGAPAANADLAHSPVPITAEAAVSTAKSESNDAGVTSIDLEFERRHDTWVYSIDLQDQNKEYEVNIDAVTGSVLATDSEPAEEPEATVSPSEPLPYAEALELAQAQGQGRLAGWSLDEDDGAVEYTFEFGDDPDDIEVVVNTETKRVYVDD